MRPRRTTADWITDGRSETMSPAREAPDVSIYYRVARGRGASEETAIRGAWHGSNSPQPSLIVLRSSPREAVRRLALPLRCLPVVALSAWCSTRADTQERLLVLRFKSTASPLPLTRLATAAVRAGLDAIKP